MKTKTRITIAVLLIFAGFIVLFHNFFLARKTKAFETIKFDLFDNMENIENDVTESLSNDPVADSGNNEENNTEVEEDVKPKEYSYIGYLEIPKIKLKKGFVDINSPSNNIKENVTIIESSSYPDVDGGNLILAAHSGNVYIGFFDKLYKLTNGDLAYIYYNNLKYTYKLVNSYKEPKTGVVGIYRDYSKTTLTLITCTNNDDTTQSIYILELIDKG